MDPSSASKNAWRIRAASCHSTELHATETTRWRLSRENKSEPLKRNIALSLFPLSPPFTPSASFLSSWPDTPSPAGQRDCRKIKFRFPWRPLKFTFGDPVAACCFPPCEFVFREAPYYSDIKTPVLLFLSKHSKPSKQAISSKNPRAILRSGNESVCLSARRNCSDVKNELLREDKYFGW